MLFINSLVNKVHEPQIGMLHHHPGTGKPHHLPDIIAHIRFIAVHRAMNTNRFPVSEPALLSSLPGVFDQSSAIGTQAIFLIVPAPAKHTDHHFNCPLLAPYPPVHITSP
jgi:hypothetical protein